MNHRRHNGRSCVAAAVGALVVALSLGDAAGAAAGVGSTGRGEESFAPGELLVRFRPDISAERRRALRAEPGASLKSRLDLPGLELVEIPEDDSVKGAARELEALPGVRYAEPNFYRRLAVVPDDPGFPQLWGLENTGQTVRRTTGTPGADIAAPAAWETTTGSSAVAVAVVDDGVDYTHPDLAPNIWRNAGEVGGGRETNGVDDDGNGRVDDWRGWDFAGNDNDPAPSGSDADHGTHVAGTIGANGNDGSGVVGVNWDVALMPVRVFGSDGATTIARLVGAYRYASTAGARVLNASFGGSGFSRSERDAIAAAPGMLFAAAAGNESENNDALATYPCNYALANVVCVAATNQKDVLATFSNYGASSVDLAAPGVNVLSTIRGGRFAYFGGTSMATPHVAGAAALLWADDPAQVVSDVRTRLLGGVDRLRSLTGKVATGGRLDAAGALAHEGGDLQGGDPGPAGNAAADRTPPETTITKAPPRRTKRHRARFRFRASEPARFDCKLDQRRWRSCSSPKRYRNLAFGRHVFRVRATDLAGNREPKPAKRAWRVKR